MAGLLLFPLMSWGVLSVAWLLSFVLLPVPELLYWLLTIALHFSYLFVALSLLVGIKGMTLERAAIGAIILQYLALLVVLVLLVINAI